MQYGEIGTFPTYFLLFGLNHSSLWTKSGLALRTQLETPIKWMEAYRFSSSKQSVPYSMCYEGDVHCGVWHWWGNNVPRCTSRADCLILHIPAAQSSSSAKEKTTTLGDTEPHILLDNARSHTALAVTDLLRRWQWEILEHPPYSPDISPRDYDLFAKVKGTLRGTRYNLSVLL